MITMILTMLFGYHAITIQKPNSWIMPVTMYSSVESCSKDCIMVDGQRAHDGAAACPRIWPLETKIEILGKEFTCEDHTNLKYDGRIDLWAGYGSIAHQTAIEWGIKKLEVIKK